MEQMKTLIKLELCNLYGLNVLKYTKDRNEKKKKIAMACIVGAIVAFIMFYMGAMSYGLIQLGASDIVPAYLTAIASIFILVFSIFKASGIIFRNKGYDMISSLPLSDLAVVMSRFTRLYVENLGVSMVIMVPGLVVYGVLTVSAISSYIIGVISIFVVPFIPGAIAIGIGALITGISSRMKHKSLVEAGLSVLIVIGVLALTSVFSGKSDEFTPEMIKNMNEMVSAALGKIYPLAILLGNGIVQGNYIRLLFCVVVSIVPFATIAVVVSGNYHSICRNLYSTVTKHDYKMEKLQKNSLLKALVLREAKRYFSSGVYVTNTIIGPILGTAFSIGILFVDMDSIMVQMPISINVNAALPFAVAGIFCTMTAASVAVSIEGKEWWIIKSLPLTTKNILDGKIVFNICLLAPFYIVSELIIMVTQNITVAERFWFILIPAIVIVFASVFGITVNLKLPKFDWESETAVVKQSASAMIGGMGGLLVALFIMVVVLLLPMKYVNIANAVICIVLIVITGCLYRNNNRVDLKSI